MIYANCKFFWQFGGQLYLLVTEEGYKDHPNVVWEMLNEVCFPSSWNIDVMHSQLCIQSFINKLRLILIVFQVNGNTPFMTGNFKKFRAECDYVSNTCVEENFWTAVLSSSLQINLKFRFFANFVNDLFWLIFYRSILLVLMMLRMIIPVSSKHPTLSLHNFTFS